MTWLEYSLLGFLALVAIWIGRDLLRLRVRRNSRALRLNPNFLRRMK